MLENRWVDDAAGDGILPNPSQKLRADVFRHTFRVSENVCHDAGLAPYHNRLRERVFAVSVKLECPTEVGVEFGTSGICIETDKLIALSRWSNPAYI